MIINITDSIAGFSQGVIEFVVGNHDYIRFFFSSSQLQAGTIKSGGYEITNALPSTQYRGLLLLSASLLTLP